MCDPPCGHRVACRVHRARVGEKMIVLEFLGPLGLAMSYLRLDGSTASEDRQALIDEFNQVWATARPATADGTSRHGTSRHGGHPAGAGTRGRATARRGRARTDWPQIGGSRGKNRVCVGTLLLLARFSWFRSLFYFSGV